MHSFRTASTFSDTKDQNIIRVKLQRRPEGFGFCVSKRDVCPYVVVSQIIPKSIAETSGLIRVGDVLIRVNGVDLSRIDYQHALKSLTSIRTNEVAELLIKVPSGYVTHLETTFNSKGVPRTRRVSTPITVATASTNFISQNEATGRTEAVLAKNGTVNGRTEKTYNNSDIANSEQMHSAKDYMKHSIKTDVSNTNTNQSDASDAKNNKQRIAIQQQRNSTPNGNYGINSSTFIKRCPAAGYQAHVKLRNLVAEQTSSDTLHSKAIDNVLCSEHRCLGALMAKVPERSLGVPRPQQEVLEHAADFMEQYFSSIEKLGTPAHKQRLNNVSASIKRTGLYDLTVDELTFGVRTGWRNAPRCIGRIQWSNLKVFDARHVRTAKEMFESVCTHIKYGTNGGKIQSAITIFPQRTDGKHDFRLWNAQYIRYAGYVQNDGSVTGDPSNVEFTKVCLEMGWKPKNGMFDVLPLVLQANGEDPEMFDIPPDLVLEVPIKHPNYPWFEKLNLKWFALPAVSMMMFDCGGLEFTAAPFNGWYMGTEVGARDLCDQQRYNITKTVALHMGLDVRKTTSLWQDRALLEVNIAVLYSYQEAGVTIADHHTMSESFMKFAKNEQRLRGGYPADWVWIVPPISGSLTPVFHQEMLMYKLKPSYEYQIDPWEIHVWKNDIGKMKLGQKKKYSLRVVALAARFASSMMKYALAKRIKCAILYATETGRSESFANTLYESFKQVFNTRVICMKDYVINQLTSETLVLVVASTFGNGDPPENGIKFSNLLSRLVQLQTRNTVNNLNVSGKVRYSVFALGSSAYPHFCEFGHHVDKMLEQFGASRFYCLQEGDELCGQDDTFLQWAQGVFKTACHLFDVGDTEIRHDVVNALASTDSSWSSGKFRLNPAYHKSEPEICEALSQLHGRELLPCRLIERRQLQKPGSSRETILVRLKAVDTSTTTLAHVPGDHIAFFPANSPELVNTILKSLTDVQYPDQLIQVEIARDHNQALEQKEQELGKTWERFRKMPLCTVRTALTRFIDITTTPSQAMLKLLATQATDDQEYLEELGTNNNTYEAWKYYRFPNLAEVLGEFPSIQLSSLFLLTQFPLLQKRFYSNSSSLDVYPGEIHATVSVIEYQTQSGAHHDGVCSSWLNRVKIGETVPCFIRQATSFHMPDDRALPVIMVGPGTGIAPFRGFWQQRSIDKRTTLKTGAKTSWGKMYLYFGCRQSDVDNIYANEIIDATREGVIDEYYLALSREPRKHKMYVQDLLKKNRKSVYDTLVNKRGHLYICGDVQIALDIIDTIVEIFQMSGNMKLAQATTCLSTLKDENRLHQDIFGVAFRSLEVTNRGNLSGQMKRGTSLEMH